ncbi:MAG: hypothetical protein BAJALOKI1v1_620004 [Promethearchaeota archaeon]|nr:MAG: hypothetical protein BAJALOKI1v1_620004 [Candidatus Lokiarchaeota archaeon]
MNNKTIQKGEIEVETTNCPSCGKMVPKKEYCEICGATFQPKKRIKTKAIFIFILIIAAIGISMLIYGYVVGNRITPIANITTDMEGQRKRIQGTVIGIDYWDTYERTTFFIMGETGFIEVSGWAEFTTDLKLSGYPGIGDKIIVEGEVSVYLGQVSLEVENVDNMLIEPQIPIPVNIENIGLALYGTKVIIQGNITEVNEYDWGSILTIEDATDEIEFEITTNRIAFTDGRAQIPKENETIILMGMVSHYRFEPQIIPSYLIYNTI